MTLSYAPELSKQIAALKASLPYLIPDNVVAFAMVIVACILFISFMNIRHRLSLSLSKELKQLRELSDPEFVRSLLEGGALTKAKDPVLVQRLFYVVWEAGQRESRLDLQEMTALAEDTYDRGMDILKTYVSSFIVIGLLGTLFGLAYTFGNLSLYSINESETIKGLLPGLRSAFAPSMWGVGFSVIGLYSHNRLVSKHYNPFIVKLRETIISIWVPVLYPTSPQKWAQILQRSASELHIVLEEISKQSRTSYIEFAEHVAQMTKNLRDLNSVTGDTKEASKRFRTMLTAAEKASTSLVSAVETLTVSQNKMKTVSEQFTTIITSQIDRWDAQVAAFARQYDAVQQLMAEIQSQIDRVTGVITEGFDRNSERLREIPDRLDAIKAELARLGDPLKTSSENIHDSFVTFTKYVETEFQPWVRSLIERVDIQKQIDGLRASVEAYLKILPSLDTELKERKLSSVTRDQVELLKQEIVRNVSNATQHLERVTKTVKDADIEGSAKRIERLSESTLSGIGKSNEHLLKVEGILTELLTSAREASTRLENLKKHPPSIWDSLFKR